MREVFKHVLRGLIVPDFAGGLFFIRDKLQVRGLVFPGPGTCACPGILRWPRLGYNNHSNVTGAGRTRIKIGVMDNDSLPGLIFKHGYQVEKEGKDKDLQGTSRDVDGWNENCSPGGNQARATSPKDKAAGVIEFSGLQERYRWMSWRFDKRLVGIMIKVAEMDKLLTCWVIMCYLFHSFQPPFSDAEGEDLRALMIGRPFLLLSLMVCTSVF